MCYYETMGVNARYMKNQKNGGVIPPINDYRALHVPRPCGRCKTCRAKRAREWQIRLYEDIKKHRNGKMVTLTMSNQHYKELYEQVPKTKVMPKGDVKELNPYEIDNAVATLAVKRFRERWRKETGQSIRHWLVTELGHNGTENIHLHGLLWTSATFKEIRSKWHYGYIWPRRDEENQNYVSVRTINYSIKYVHKMDLKHKMYNSIILGSPGLGKAYINATTLKKHKYNGKDTIITYTTETGHEMALPKYYMNKLYTDEQKEKLWMYNEDKLIRWLDKEKIDISKNKKAYFNILGHYRQKNKELGYGTNIPNANRRKYEHERRKVYQRARLKIQNTDQQKVKLSNQTRPRITIQLKA